MPSSRLAFVMLNAANVEAIAIHMESYAMYLPGQIRLPNPKAATAGLRTSGLILPSFMNRSGLNAKGSGYTFSSCRIALKRDVVNTLFVYKAGGLITMYCPPQACLWAGNNLRIYHRHWIGEEQLPKILCQSNSKRHERSLIRTKRNHWVPAQRFLHNGINVW